MTEPPAPSWPVPGFADPHRRPLPVGLASAIGLLWSVVVLVLAVRFGLHPTRNDWRHADPTGLLPHGTWWRIGVAAFFAVWCGLGAWFALAAYRRQGWAAIALAISALLALLLSGYEVRTIIDVPVPLGALISLLLLGLPVTRAWYAAREP